ncbi:unnamed protein product [Caenorhabditis auriculariae]|uniref:glutathione-specific gamma-glutamylcyclotransferase n=1 Tax=Caenorhabditis auriculariae TaxID=2777116 RepID=A0A8S1GVL9_9PELO|nr:unnamed protein product [Caenorhabditis auriculariae]
METAENLQMSWTVIRKFHGFIKISSTTNKNKMQQPSLWVFGYGSLIWNPGFDYSLKQKAYAIGWVRRMYQGNVYHRGNEKLPGRVATMVEEASSITNGVAFRIDGVKGITSAIEHLREREVDNGYSFRMISVELADGSMVRALTCVADVSYSYYLGPDELEKMARDILNARGCAGPNCEYVLKLAEHVRLLFPEDDDEHLFGLEMIVRTARVLA